MPKSIDEIVSGVFGESKATPSTRAPSNSIDDIVASIFDSNNSDADYAQEAANFEAPIPEAAIPGVNTPRNMPAGGALPQLQPVDEAKLFARTQSLRYMPSNAGLTPEELDAMARQQLQPEELAKEQQAWEIRKAEGLYDQANQAVAPRFSRPIQTTQEQDTEFAARMGVQAPVTQQPQQIAPPPNLSPREQEIYSLAVKQITRQYEMQGDAELYQRREDQARADAAANTIGNRYFPTGPREVGSGFADAGVGIGQIGIAAKDLVTGSEDAQYATQVRSDMARATADAGKDSVVPEWVRNAARGATSSLATAALAGGGTNAAVAAGLTSSADALGEAQAGGLKGGHALIYAGVQGALEAGLEKAAQGMGAGGVESILSGERVFVQRGLIAALKEAGKTIGQEAATEIPTSTLQELARTAVSEGKIRGAQTAEEWTNVWRDTLAQTVFAGGATHAKQIADAAGKAGVTRQMLESGSNSRKLLDLIPEQFLPSETRRKISQADRVQALELLRKQVEQQPELKTANPDERIGAQYAEPVQGVDTSRGVSAEQSDRDIAEHDASIRRNYTPQIRDVADEFADVPKAEPTGETLPPADTAQQRQDMIRALMRNGYSEKAAIAKIEAAVSPKQAVSPSGETVDSNETGLPSGIDDPVSSGFFSRKRSPKSPNNKSARERALLGGLNTEPAGDMMRDDQFQESFNKPARKVLKDAQGLSYELKEQNYTREAEEFGAKSEQAIKQAELEQMKARGIEPMSPDEAVQDLESQKIDRALEEAGVQSKPQTERRSDPKTRATVDTIVKAMDEHHETTRAKGIPRDPLSGMISDRDKVFRKPVIEQAIKQGHSVVTGDSDIANVGGVNDALSEEGTDKHLKKVYEFISKELGHIVNMRRGGDEGTHVAVDDAADTAALDAAAQRADAKIREYNQKTWVTTVKDIKDKKTGEVIIPAGTRMKLADIPNPKGGAGGLGFYAVFSKYEGGDVQQHIDKQAIDLIQKKDKAKYGKEQTGGTGPVGGRSAAIPEARSEAVGVGKPDQPTQVGQSNIPAPKEDGGVQREGSPAPVAGPKRPIERGAVEKHFPGFKVEDTKDGYKVSLRSRSYEVKFGKPKISKAQAEREIGKKLSQEEFDHYVKEGHIVAEGETRSGKGVVMLAENATEKTLRHEAVHLGRELFADAEWNALRKQYGKAGDSKKVVEERVAKARENWDGTVKGEGDKVFAAMDKPGFWDRNLPPEPPKGASTEQPDGKPFGKPELANPSLTPEGRESQDIVDEAMKQSGKPEKRARSVAESEANKEFVSDYEGAKSKLLKGELATENEKDVHLARLVMDKLNNDALGSDDPKKIDDAIQARINYRTAGTEQARAFAARRDLLLPPKERMRAAILEMLLAPDKKHAAMIAKAKNAVEKTAALKAWGKRSGEIKNSLNISPELLAQMSEQEAAQKLNEIAAAKSDNYDAAYEYWRNAILSAPSTHAVNITGNALHATWHYTAERLAEATLSAIRLTGENSASFGEFQHIAKGFLPGIASGYRNALQAWKTEQPIFGNDGKQETGDGIAIEGTKGRVIRAPQRALLAADEFFKALIANLEVGAQAYRIAKGEKLSGEAMTKRIAELHADKGSSAWAEAMNKATELTFQKRSHASSAIVNLRSAIPGLRYVIPFVTTPYNVLVTGVKKSPAGSVALGYKMVKNLQEGRKATDGLSAEMAQQFIASAITLALASSMKDGEDEWITGTSETKYDPANPGKSGFIKSVRPPLSIKIGNKWHSYGRVEPFATAIGTTIDAIKGFKKGGAVSGAFGAGRSLLDQVEEKTFLKGLADLLEVAQKPDSEAARRYATNFATSWVPNIIRSPARAMRDSVDERGAWGKGEDYKQMALERLSQGTELPLTPKDMPRYDVWGEPLKKSAGESPRTDVLSRILSPVQSKDASVNQAARLILNWNNVAPEGEQVWPMVPPKNYKVRDETKYMTEEQYDRYTRETGQELKRLVEQAIATGWDVTKPKKFMVDHVEKLTTQIRKVWRAKNLSADTSAQ